MTMTETRPVIPGGDIAGGEWSVSADMIPDMVNAIRGMAIVAGDPARGYDVIAFTVGDDGSCHMAVTDSYRAIRVAFPAGTVRRGTCLAGSFALAADDLAAIVKGGKPGKNDTLTFRFYGSLPVSVIYRANGSTNSRNVPVRDVKPHLTPGGIDRLIPEPVFEGGRFDIGRFGGIVKALGIMCGASRKTEPVFDVLAMSERKPAHIVATTPGGVSIDAIIMPVRK